MTTDIEIEKLEAERESLRSKLAEAERERDEATKYAKTLCESFVHEHCSPVETWKVFPDLIGVLTQIYNATTVVRSIKADRDAAFSELAKLRERTTKLSIDYIVALDEKGKALAELAKLRAEAEWRPIESAPRDGTKVLVALHEFNDPANLYVSCFAAFENGSWIEGGEPIYQPDYFFAIPSPPKDPAHD
jgi:sugar-specific transcriptional regulator TrmB